MAIVRYDSLRELDSLQGEMNRLFDGFFGSRTAGRSGGVSRWVPPMDLIERGDEFVVRADLPGMAEEDVAVEIKDHVLTISGERRAESEQEGESYYRAERAFGGFTRTLTLPDGVEPGAVKAHFAHGVLEVRIPKPADREPHKVAIETGAAEAPALEGEATER